MGPSVAGVLGNLVGWVIYAAVVLGALFWLVRTLTGLRTAQREARIAQRDLEERVRALEAEASRRRGT